MQKVPLLIIILILLFSCNGKNNSVKSNFSFAATQLTLAIRETEKGISENKAKNYVAPRTIDEAGKLVLSPPREWTSGFFAGELWYMYEFTQDDKWKKAAQQYTANIEQEKTNGTTHDMGFKLYCSIGNGFRLTKDEHYKKVLIEAAYTLASRFKPQAGIIRSWDHSNDKWQCPVIIDNMMNLELLFWAFKETQDSTFYKIAVSHANTTMKNHFRKDYSSYHVVDYDTISGNILSKSTHQGYSDESAWARGQAWGAYGFTMAYRQTGDTAYLNLAKHIVNYIFTNPNLPTDLIPYWDYNAPNIPNEPRDVSAATCTASALYELSLYDKANSTQYRNWADMILKNLSENYLAKKGGDYGFLLLHSVGSKPGNAEVDKPLVYADYYFLEALLRKKQIENN
ncbi:MAG: glycoside hydrolase family 88 protein [Dysgonamonadaceae bacterium]|jgi:rhamnogalacturonyl hydrolase YesR|nr:glycoside hydrolase family 88 protein [Dysgonamonadaceae bacterium]